MRSSLWHDGKGKWNDDNGIPPAEPLSAVSGFLSQAESSTIGSAARAEILPTVRQWLDDLGRNLSLQPADVSKALPTSAGRGLWFRPVSFQRKGKEQSDHRRYLCPEAVSAARPLTLKLHCAIWLSLDGTFACCQHAVSRQSVPTDQLSVQYLYCTDSVRSVMTDGLRQRQWAVVPFSCSPKPSVILPRKESKEYASIGDTTLRAKQNGSTRRMRPIGSIRPTCERGKATPIGWPPSNSLYLALFMVTVVSPVRHNHMVEEMDSHHLTGLLDALCQHIVGLAR